VKQVPLPARPSRPEALEPANEFGNCGIHCIALSPGGELLATGGTEPADCVVLHVPTMQTVQTNIVSPFCNPQPLRGMMLFEQYHAF